MSIMGYIKEHPYQTGGAVFVIGILWLLLRGKGGDTVYTTNTGPSQSEVQYGTQLQIASIQAQQASYQTSAAQTVALSNIDAQVQIAAIQNNTTQNANTLSADTAKTIADLQAQTIQLQSTLSARVSQVQYDDQLEAIKASTAGQVAIAALPYQTRLAEIAAVRDIKLADINAQASANSTAIADLLSRFNTLEAGSTSNDVALSNWLRSIQNGLINLSNFTQDEVTGLAAKGYGSPVTKTNLTPGGNMMPYDLTTIPTQTV